MPTIDAALPAAPATTGGPDTSGDAPSVPSGYSPSSVAVALGCTMSVLGAVDGTTIGAAVLGTTPTTPSVLVWKPTRGTSAVCSMVSTVEDPSMVDPSSTHGTVVVLVTTMVVYASVAVCLGGSVTVMTRVMESTPVTMPGFSGTWPAQRPWK